jgi:hypothetical protein
LEDHRPGEIALRKLVATLTFLALVALPATALAQPHWYRGSDAQVTVYVEKTRVGATNWSYVKRAGIEWARSSRIRVVFVKPCPSRYYCLKVYEGSSTRPLAGWTTLNYDPKTNLAWYGQPAPEQPLPDHRLGPAQDRLPRARPRRRPRPPPDRHDLHARRLHHHVRPPRRHRLRQPAPDLRLTPA